MTEQGITAKVRILGIFYRGEDKPLLFSVEVEGRNDITYAEIPTKDAEFRAMAKDSGKPLKQWVLDWNDAEIERDQKRTDELVKLGLASVGTLTGDAATSFHQSLTEMNERFLKSIGAEEML